MIIPVTDGKMLVNATYHSVVVSGFFAIGYARKAKMITEASPPKLDFNGYDISMMVLDVGLAITTKGILIMNFVNKDIQFKRLRMLLRPTISQFYTPTKAQKDREIALIVFGLTGVSIFSYIIMHKL